MTTTATEFQVEIEVGDFVSIPAWNVTGMVMDVRGSYVGAEDSIDVLLQHDVDEPCWKWKTYRLAPGEYSVEW